MAKTVLIVSPHPDDAAFSLGGFLLNHPASEIIVWDIFSQQSYSIYPGWENPQESILIEETAAMAMAEARVIFAGLPEAGLRGYQKLRTILHQVYKHEEQSEISGQVKKEFLKVLHEVIPDEIYIPLGCGGHIDHLIARETVLECWAKGGKKEQVFLYEELPYCANTQWREQSLQQLAAWDLKRCEIDITAVMEKKIEMMTLYKSQVKEREVRKMAGHAYEAESSRAVERVWQVDGNRRLKLLLNDLVVRPDKCNFRCQYCLSEEAADMELGECGFVNPEALMYSADSTLGKRLDRAMEGFHRTFSANILRISGGELFLIKNIEAFLARQTAYETIQIITNGSMLTQERLEKLKAIGKCQLHISLDGYTWEQNRYRVRTQREHDNLLRNLEQAVSYGFDIEIGSVLTDANTGTYQEFLTYLQSLKGKITAYPFPIRGQVRNQFYPAEADIRKFINILEMYDVYQDILPPKPFIEEAIQLLTGKRTLKCQIPAFMVQLFDSGNMTPCPNSWTATIGNTCTDSSAVIQEKMKHEKMYKLFLQDRPRLECCHSCFTSLDMINLYLDDRITYEEISSIPLYAGAKTRTFLKELKKGGAADESKSDYSNI